MSCGRACYRCGKPITPRGECGCKDGICLILGDCRDVLPLLEPGSVDLVLTDPPYGVGKAEWDIAFHSEWLAALPSTPCIGITPGVCNLLRLPFVIGEAQYRWMLTGYITNGKTRGATGFCNQIPCLVYATEGVSLYGCAQDIKPFAIKGDMPNHPSPKPFTFWKWLLGSLPGKSVLDPFAGSGTTLRAAKDLGRRAIGIEIEEKYVRIAANRLRQEVLF